MAKKKTHYVLVKINAPEELTASAVRREVRSLINDQCNISADMGDLKAAKVSPVPAGWVGTGK